MIIIELIKRFFVFMAALFVFIIGKLLYMSCRVEKIMSREFAELEASNDPFVYSFWHGRLFAFGFLRPKHRRVFAIVSRHGDGEMISEVMKIAGIDAIRGSANRKKNDVRIKGEIKIASAKDRGGSAVLRESIKTLKAGNCVAITPDGPKGPRFVFKNNFLTVLALSGVPIVPASYSANRTWVLKSWDRFLIPKPFSRIKVIYGTPIFIPRDSTAEQLETYGKQIENTLNELTAELDKEFGIKLESNS